MPTYDRVIAVVGCNHGYGKIEPEEGADATGVDDEIVSHLDAPFAEQPLETGLVQRVSQHEDGAAASQVTTHGVDLGT